MNVRVTTATGTSAITRKDQYTYENAPTVTAVSPSDGTDAGGSTVTVTGTGFLAVKRVTFGGTAGTTVTVTSPARLTVTSPAHATGTVDVQVTSLAGPSVASTGDQYTYTVPPVTGVKTGPVTTSVKLSWTDPVFPGFGGVVIRRATGTTPPSGPTKGTAVASVGPTVTRYTNKGLKAGTTYSYALFAHDSTGHYGPAAAITVTAVPGRVNVSGTLTHNTTWSPAAATVYILKGTVTVPQGVTLTIDPGTVVKGLSDGLTVEGTLDVSGTSASPVVFTSVNDNSVGGSTGSGNPQAADWGGISIDGSGTANIGNTTISYAATAINASGTVAVAFRGTLTNNTMDITSCDWGTGACGVDAAYSNWGDGSAGPFPASGRLVCGVVTVSPWLPTNNNAATVFSDGDCGGGTTPDATLSNAEATFNQDIANEQIQCNDGYQDACQAIQTAQNCLSAAYNLAQAQSPFTLPALGGDVVGAGSSWLKNSESQVVSDIGAVTGFLNDILGVVTTVLDIANAYNQCDP